MRKKTLTLIVVTLFIGLIFSSVNAGLSKQKNKFEYDEDIDDLFFDIYLTILMKLAHKPSISMCIIINASVVWSKGYGLYDIENNKPATKDTIYLMASISKSVTATALMQLYDQGHIDLDDDLNNYLPFNFRNPNHPDIPITFRMLLSHRTSLGGDSSDQVSNSILPGDPDIPSYPHQWFEEYLIPGGSAYHSEIWSDSMPGEKYFYTNVGFSLIGYLVELISGQNFNEYCKENIFIPLKMYNTSFRLKDFNVSKIAVPYFYSDGKFIPNSHYGYLVLHPSATLRTSIEELSHFLIAHMNGGLYNNVRILNESTVNLMHTAHYPLNENGRGYGLGFTISESDSGKKEVGHSGGWPGVHTLMKFRPEDKTAFIFFTNSYDSSKISGPIAGVALKLIRNALIIKTNKLAS